MTTTIHGYYVDKARAAFTAAGGDPDHSGPLAQWAQDHRDDPHAGVIIADTGEILAQTRRVVPTRGQRVAATYVTEVTHAADEDALRLEAGLVMGRLARRHGPVIHVTHTDVCRGPGRR